MDEKAYLTERVEDQLRYYESAANKAKRQHIWMQSSVIVLSVSVPVVANISGWDATRALVTILAVVLAMLNGVLTFRKFGDLWLSYRTTEELLKKEKFLFETRTGPYTSGDNPFDRFVQTIESLLSVEHERFRSLIVSASRPTKPKADGGQ